MYCFERHWKWDFRLCGSGGLCYWCDVGFQEIKHWNDIDVIEEIRRWNIPVCSLSSL